MTAVLEPGVMWWQLAGCTETADLHTAPVTSGHTDPGSPQAKAVHICLQHCPVFAQCERDIADRPPIGIVQAGVLWPDTHHRRPSAVQPPDPGHGPWCSHLRGIR